MLARDVRSRVQAASLRENREWDGVKTRDDWERFRQPRLRALRESLGLPSATPGPRGCSSRGRWKATATGSRTSSSRAGRGWW